MRSSCASTITPLARNVLKALISGAMAKSPRVGRKKLPLCVSGAEGGVVAFWHLRNITKGPFSLILLPEFSYLFSLSVGDR